MGITAQIDSKELRASLVEEEPLSGDVNGAGGGTTDHSKLANRNAKDQHPMSAITGLEKALEDKSPSDHTHTASDVGARPDTWMPAASDVGARPATWTPTAEEVGARPDTWMPTAEQVGARPNTWTPTASDVGASPAGHAHTAEQIGASPTGHTHTAEEVGARPNTWIPTAEQVGARPDTWTPTASQVGARPSTWMPTASDVGARPSTWMPTASDVGARPNTWMPTASDVGALSLAGGTLQGDLNIDGHVLWGLGNPTGYDQPVPYRMFVDELDKKAPSGFGLGTGGKYVPSSNVDSIFDGGFWRWDVGNDQTPFANATMLVVPRQEDVSATQLAFCNAATYKDIIAFRTTTSAIPGEWMFLNPYLSVGNEYLTIERRKGKSVYKKLISFGTLPASGEKNVNTNIAFSNYEIVGYSIQLLHSSGNYVYFMTPNLTFGFYKSGDNWHATAEAHSDLSAYTVTVEISYVKKG